MFTLDWSFLSKKVVGNQTYLGWLMTAWETTLTISLFAFIIAFTLGFLMGVLIGNIWTEIFRNIPVLVQIFLWYFVMPKLFPIFSKLPSFALAVIALGLFTSSRISEQVRAGIQSIPTDQRYASLALGLTTYQSYRFVLLPVALISSTSINE
jgi:glutamate/aspartate transport system permease protein